MFRAVPLSVIRSFFTVHTAMVCVIQVTVTACEQDQNGTGSVLILLASCQQTCMTYTFAMCRVKKLLLMDRGTVRNMYSFIPKINLRNQCIYLVLL